MRYILKINAMGRLPELDISKTRYNKIKQSKLILDNSISIEEKYEILLLNYMEFEKEILNLTTTDMIRPLSNYGDFYDARLIFNRLVVNLLTSIKLYYDQLWRHIRACLPSDKDAKSDTAKLFNEQYDLNPEYRFMEELRNYVQHRELAVHRTVFGGKWIKEDGNSKLEHSAEISALREYLSEDIKFKKKVLNEFGDVIDLKATTRKYVESISEIHESARAMIKSNVDNARKEFEKAISDYMELYSKDIVGLCAMHMSSEIKPIEIIPILLDWDNVRIILGEKNKSLSKLNKWYVTSKATS